MTTLVVKSIYDFQSTDLKCLSFAAEEHFIVVKLSKPAEWLYVVNSQGKLGYVPANYVNDIKLDDAELLSLIDSVAAKLDAKHNDMVVITDRQIKHAQIKLAQQRCEVFQRLYKRRHPETIIEDESQESEIVENNDGEGKNVHATAKDEQSTTTTNKPPPATTTNCKESSHHSQNKTVLSLTEKHDKIPHTHDQDSIQVPENLIPELIERVRVCTDLSHGMCTLTVKTVIECLAEMMPLLTGPCQQILDKLGGGAIHSHSQSADLINLRTTFKKLWHCKNDEQQRTWPVHEDEQMIRDYLEEILQIISKANIEDIREVVCKEHYDNIHMLVTYFQMESRKSLRMKIFAIFSSLMSLFENLIPDYFLVSVLPSELAVEMLNHVQDAERWSAAANVFTRIFSTGHKPPVNIYVQLNETFIQRLLDVIEDFDADGQKLNSSISPEVAIAPVLSFNLHFSDPKTNIVLSALRKRQTASQLTQNLVSYLNWEEDITRVWGNSKDSDCQRPNAVLKLLIEMFGDSQVAKLFYYNDVRVVIDIIIRQLNNLPAGDPSRASYLQLALNAIRNTSYAEEPHKIDEFSKSLNSIKTHENSTSEDCRLVQQLFTENESIFSSR